MKNHINRQVAKRDDLYEADDVVKVDQKFEQDSMLDLLASFLTCHGGHSTFFDRIEIADVQVVVEHDSNEHTR